MHKIELGQENVKEKQALDSFLSLTSSKDDTFEFFLQEGEEKKIILFASSGSLQNITCHLGKMSSLIFIYVGCDSSDKTEVFLEGEEASLQYYYVSLSKDAISHEISVHHLADRTVSSLQNHGVNLQNKSMKFYINSFINKCTIDCVSEQNNRIIEMKNGVSTILPNLQVDSFQVVANHSAHIGKFTQDELFYLTSRGISLDESYRLLLKGFLLANLPCGQGDIDLIRKYYQF